MYGVGLNPIYIARLEEQQARKEASGEANRTVRSGHYCQTEGGG